MNNETRKTKRIINQKIIPIVIFLFLCIWFAGCASRNEMKDKFYKKGTELLEKADYKRAELEFKNALKVDPKFDKGYNKLAYCAFHFKNFNKAFALASKAVELNPENLEAHILLGRLYFMAKKLDEAQGKVNLVLNKDTSNKESLLLQSSLFFAQGKYSKAEEILKKIISLKDQGSEAYLLLAKLYIQQKDLKKANDILREGLSRSKDSFELSLALASVYIMQNNLKAAEKIYKDYKDQLLLVRFYLEIEKSTDKGIAVLQKLIDEKPDKEEYWITLAQVYTKNKEEDKAEKILQDSIKKISPGYKVRLALAKFYMDHQQVEKSIKLLKEAAAREPESVESLEISTRLAHLYWGQNKSDLALIELNQVIKKNSKDFQAHFLRGEIFLKDKKSLDAIGDFSQCINQEPNYAPAYDRLAQAHLLNKEENLAIDYLKKALTLNPQLYSSLDSLLAIYWKRDAVKDILSQLKALIDRNPKDIYVIGKLGDTYLRKNEFGNAEKYYHQVLEIDPNNYSTHYQLGLLFMKQNKNEEAKIRFQKVLAVNPKFFSALEGLVGCLFQEKKMNESLEVCSNYLRSFPDHNRDKIYNLMGCIYTAKQDREESKKFFTQAIMANPGWAVPYTHLVELFYQEGKPREGLEYFKELKKKYPQQPFSDFSCGMLYLKNTEYDKAKEVFEKVLEEYPKFIFAANNLAYIYAEYFPSRENLEKAQKLASQVVQDYPHQYDTMDTLAWIHCKQGDYKKGIELYKDFGLLSMNNPVYAYHLGICYLKEGNREKALLYLKKAADSPSHSNETKEAKRVLESMKL